VLWVTGESLHLWRGRERVTSGKIGHKIVLETANGTQNSNLGLIKDTINPPHHQRSYHQQNEFFE
jgi:hypothetical protein